MSGWSLAANNFLETYTCANNPAQLFSLNAAGQVEAGGPGTSLCVTTQGSPNGQYPVRELGLQGAAAPKRRPASPEKSELPDSRQC